MTNTSQINRSEPKPQVAPRPSIPVPDPELDKAAYDILLTENPGVLTHLADEVAYGNSLEGLYYSLMDRAESKAEPTKGRLVAEKYYRAGCWIRNSDELMAKHASVPYFSPALTFERNLEINRPSVIAIAREVLLGLSVSDAINALMTEPDANGNARSAVQDNYAKANAEGLSLIFQHLHDHPDVAQQLWNDGSYLESFPDGDQVALNAYRTRNGDRALRAVANLALSKGIEQAKQAYLDFTRTMPLYLRLSSIPMLREAFAVMRFVIANPTNWMA